MFWNKSKQEREKVTRYSIRKYSFGAASVAVAIGFFAMGPVAQADTVAPEKVAEVATTTSPAESQVQPTSSQMAETVESKVEAPLTLEPVNSAQAGTTEQAEAAAPELEQAANLEPETGAEEAQTPPTIGYPVKEVEKPASAAMPRPANQGQALTAGTGFRANVNGSAIEDATETPKVEKPGLTTDRTAADLNKQITWLDFGETGAWTNLENDGSLKVGSTFTKEIAPDYKVTLTVKSLQPFQATEVYKNRVAGTEYENTYNASAQNHYIEGSEAKKKGETVVKLKAYEQNYWSKIKNEGFATGTKKTVIRPETDGANAGVQFELSATYKGRAVQPTMVMADGEEASPGELITYITNGSGWEHIGEWEKGDEKWPYVPQNPDTAFAEAGNGAALAADKSLPWKYFTSKDQVTAGLGTQVFGPVVSRGNTIPLIMTTGASEIGVYVTTSGQQAFMMGFIVADLSDAPASYGSASHAINPKDSISGVAIQQPFIGDKAPDPDANLDSQKSWTADDATDDADEGVEQILPDSLKNKTNGLIKLDRTDDGHYTLTVKASANGNTAAHMRAWVDFNQNGTFDENEASEFVTVNAQGDYQLKFNNNPVMNDSTVGKVGVRVRIAMDQDDIKSPTGLAYTGEVEDFEAQITYPPKGSLTQTSGDKGETQTGLVLFTAQGKEAYDYNEDSVIDESKQAAIVDENGQTVSLDSDGYYVVSGEGKYKIKSLGRTISVSFIPDANFVGKAKGITIRHWDKNGASTAWTTFDNSQSPISEQTGKMDGRFVPYVIDIQEASSTNAQGLKQTKDLDFANGTTPVTPDENHPAQFVDENGYVIAETVLDAMANGKKIGSYELDKETGRITFTPNKDFIGTADPVTVYVKDADGNQAKVIYRPRVVEVSPTGISVTTKDIQGKTQMGQPSFQEGDTRIPLSDEPAKMKDPKTGDLVNTITIANEGTYTIDADGVVTFVPEKSFVGQATGVTVVKADVNGSQAQATYKPTVTAVTPIGHPATSTGKQGQTQTGTPTFESGDPSVTLSNDPAKLKDPKTGNPVDKVTIDNVGTYEINDKGQITFTPVKTFVGEAPAVTVVKTDVNGTPAETTYTPTVEAVTPTATPATSTGKQGRPQTGTPVFTAGDPAVPIDYDKVMVFDNGSGFKLVENEGAYEIDNAGKITFTPLATFTGTATPVEVIRVDKNGTQAKTTYTPTVEAVSPTGQSVTSVGIQGAKQTGKPTFTAGDSEVPLSDYPAQLKDSETQQLFDRVVVINEGSYTIAADGIVTFTPEKTFAGQAKGVTVVKKDVNGTPAEATYIPTVKSAAPTAKDAQTTGKQGQTQIGNLQFAAASMEIDGKEVSVPLDPSSYTFLENGRAVSTKTVDARDTQGKVIGSYSLNNDGTVLFRPNKDFVGTPLGIQVQVSDTNGQTAVASYTPTVETVKPSGEDATSTGKQGLTQTGQPSFQAGDPSVALSNDPAQLKDPTSGTLVDKVVVPNEGTYTIAADGTVTFSPEKSFVGQATGVTVVKKDVNGTPAEASYIPTVEAVIPTTTPTTSRGQQGQAQTGSPVFTAGDPAVPIVIDADHPARLIDPVTGQMSLALSVAALDITGTVIGTYTIDPASGQVTFQPNPDFVGTAQAAQVVAQDANGTEVIGTYTPTVLARPAEVTPPAENPVSPAPMSHNPVAPAPSRAQSTSLSRAARNLPQTGTKEENVLPSAIMLFLAAVGLLATKTKKQDEK